MTQKNETRFGPNPCKHGGYQVLCRDCDAEEIAAMEVALGTLTCSHCGALADDQGYSIDKRCCFYCSGK